MDLKILLQLFNENKQEELFIKFNEFKNQDFIEKNKNFYKLFIFNLLNLKKFKDANRHFFNFLSLYDLDLDIFFGSYQSFEIVKKTNDITLFVLKTVNENKIRKVLNNPDKIEKLINFLIEKDEISIAIKVLRLLIIKIKENQNNSGLIYFLIGKFFYAQRKYKIAIIYFKKSYQSKQNSTVLLEIAHTLNIIGLNKECEQTLGKVISQEHNLPKAYHILSGLVDFKKRGENILINMLNTSIKQKDILKNSYLLDYAISKAYEDLGDYKSAFHFFSKANSKKKQFIHHGSEIFESETNFFLDLYKNNKVLLTKPTPVNNNVSPIFILGLPRTGTTLLERIFSSVKGVSNYGESRAFAGCFKFFFNIYDHQKAKLEFSKLTEKDFHNFGEMYLNKINRKKTNIFTDKMPFNYLYIPLIKKTLPNSKVLLLSRDYRDIGLSILKNNFADPKLNFAYSEKDISKYFSLYKKVKNYMLENYQDQICQINYEDLVGKTNETIEKISNFCKIDFDIKNLNILGNNYIADTVSINQANKIIYTSSKQAHKNYEVYLQGFFNDLVNL